MFRVELQPRKEIEDREGFTVYSLLKYGIANDVKRVIVEKFLQLPIDRILQDEVVSSIPPWNLFLVIDKHNEFDILYIKINKSNK